MTLAALHGRALARTIDGMRSLLAQGEQPSSALRSLKGLGSASLWSERGDALVARPVVVALADRLPNAAESVPAVFSLLREVRAAWLRVVRARLAEMGERKDFAALADAVTAAGALATELVKVDRPSLSPTIFSELERALLPAAAHEASAFPVLLRALAATAEMPAGAPSSSLPDIAFDDPSTAWRPGRLLRLPRLDGAGACPRGPERRARRLQQRPRLDALGAPTSVGIPARADDLHQGGVGARRCWSELRPLVCHRDGP
jgi:hypothetical protein